MKRIPKTGTHTFLFHIYIGTAYQGCMEAKNQLQAMSQWAKRHRISQDILRAEESTTVEPKKVTT